jgi:hypothetical protein
LFIIDIEPIDFMDTFAYLSALCNSYLNALLRPALREGVSGRLLLTLVRDKAGSETSPVRSLWHRAEIVG